MNTLNTHYELICAEIEACEKMKSSCQKALALHTQLALHLTLFRLKTPRTTTTTTTTTTINIRTTYGH